MAQQTTGQSDDTIATYRENLLQVRRFFTLYPDRVIVQAKWRLGGSYTNTIRLDGLEPEPGYVLIRYKWFKHAFLIFGVGAAFAVMAVFLQGNFTFTLPARIGTAIGLVGLVLCMLTSKRVPFVRFKSAGGKAGLDIAHAGPDKPRFDQFVQQVRRQIIKARRKSQS